MNEIPGSTAWSDAAGRGDPLYIAYHDTEWGVPEYDSRALWEALVLEGFQAGLSWITILRKRESFREAFQGFDPMSSPDGARPRWRACWRSRASSGTAARSRRPSEMPERGRRSRPEQGFDRYLWDHVGGRPIQNRWQTLAEVPAQTDLSRKISKDLKKRGFKFCGPTIVYAFMQAVGMVNDHLVTCPCHERVARLG